MEAECFQTSVLSFLFCDDFGNWEKINQRLEHVRRVLLLINFVFISLICLPFKTFMDFNAMHHCIAFFHILRPPYFLAYLLHLDPSRFILMRSSWYNLLQVGSSWITQAHLGPFLFIWIHIGTEGPVCPNFVRLSVR